MANAQGKLGRRWWRVWQRQPVILLLLFFLSVGVPPVAARVAGQTPMVQSQQSAYDLVRQGRRFYEAKQWEDAVRVLQQAVQGFASRGDRLNQAMASSNLSLTYQQIGQWDAAREAIAQSLNLLPANPNANASRILAQTLDIQGNLQRETGNAEEAIASWQKAANIYRNIENDRGLQQSRINQARGMQDLGLYPRACQTLLLALNVETQDCEISEQVLSQLKNQPPSPLKMQGMAGLGDVLRLIGKLEQSQLILEQSLQLGQQQIGASPELALVYLSLGNTLQGLGEREAAFEAYDTAQKMSIGDRVEIQAKLAQLSLLLAEDAFPGSFFGLQSDPEDLWRSLAADLENLPASRTGLYAQINFAESLIKRESGRKIVGENFQKIDRIFSRVAEQAKQLGDTRAEAYAIGDRGKLYELNQQWQQAETFTIEALSIASSYEKPDIAYQLFWQLGRITKAEGKVEEAIASYRYAVNTLESIRTDLVAISSQAQFDFQDSVEPVYRDFVGLLLQPGREATQEDLKLARQTIESLQLAELDNFFKDSCLNAQPAQIDEVDPTAAVLYPIILGDRLEVIAALPNQPLTHYSTPLPQEQIEGTVEEVKNYLSAPRLLIFRQRLLNNSQKIYDWLIRPIETDLAGGDVQTIVFVLDGVLRNIPMTALYDGEEYLVQKYSIAVTPGLQLVDPQPLAREELKILSGGLSEARQGYSALPGVEYELERIQAEIPTEVLLNQSFTDSQFQETINSFPFPIIHLATHGEFSSVAEDTFILTWDDRINAIELDSLLRTETREEDTSPIELLVLSACKTATGDKRAALGLAGVAVRAGARSTLASLWYVSDEATALLMTQFYQELTNTGLTKAEAFRRAQQMILQDERFSHPYYWSAFVLVGNWL